MFAFAIWDSLKQELILCRDRVGVKPLYWHYKNGLFLFASELKSFYGLSEFKKDIDEKALSAFFLFGYIPAPQAIFKNTFKLEPGHYLILNNKGEIRKTKYWDAADYTVNDNDMNEVAALEQLEDVLADSFKLRMISDVPLGLFLSGGIDSSLVASILSKQGFKLKTFTVGFYEKEWDEAIYARRVANYLGTEHAELYCTQKEAMAVIQKLPDIFDEPFGDSSAIPTYLVSSLARQRVKVALSADGADELFCGYNRYWVISTYFSKMRYIRSFSLLRKVVKFIDPNLAVSIYRLFHSLLPKYDNFRDKFAKMKRVVAAKDCEEGYAAAIANFINEDINNLGLPDARYQKLPFIKSGVMEKLMLIDLKTYLADDLLVKVDRSSMAVSLESREPFLDHKIIEFALSLPLAYKYRDGTGKYILKKLLARHMPEEFFKRPKHGFSIPLDKWLKGELKSLSAYYLSQDKLNDGPLKQEFVADLVDGFYNKNRVEYAPKLWLLLTFQMWKEKWID